MVVEEIIWHAKCSRYCEFDAIMSSLQRARKFCFPEAHSGSNGSARRQLERAEARPKAWQLRIAPEAHSGSNGCWNTGSVLSSHGQLSQVWRQSQQSRPYDPFTAGSITTRLGRPRLTESYPMSVAAATSTIGLLGWPHVATQPGRWRVPKP